MKTRNKKFVFTQSEGAMRCVFLIIALCRRIAAWENLITSLSGVKLKSVESDFTSFTLQLTEGSDLSIQVDPVSNKIRNAIVSTSLSVRRICNSCSMFSASASWTVDRRHCTVGAERRFGEVCLSIPLPVFFSRHVPHRLQLIATHYRTSLLSYFRFLVLCIGAL